MDGLAYGAIVPKLKINGNNVITKRSGKRTKIAMKS
jgi:hypothetical protein